MSQDNILEFFHSGHISHIEFHQFITEHQKKGHNHRVIHQTVSAHCGLSLASMISDRLTLSPLPTISIANGTHDLGGSLIQSSCALRLAYKYASFWLSDLTADSFYDRGVYPGGDGYRRPGEPDGHRRYAPMGQQYTPAYEPVHPNLHVDIMKVLYENIGVTAKEYERKVQQQAYFTVIDALNFGTRGIIDGIITRQLDVYRFEIRMRNDVTKMVDLQRDDFSETLDLTAAAVLNPAIAEVNKK